MCRRYTYSKNMYFRSYSSGYYGIEMMDTRLGLYNNLRNYVNKEKMSIEQIRNTVEGYIQNYSDNL